MEVQSKKALLEPKALPTPDFQSSSLPSEQASETPGPDSPVDPFSAPDSAPTRAQLPSPQPLIHQASAQLRQLLLDEARRSQVNAECRDELPGARFQRSGIPGFGLYLLSLEPEAHSPDRGEWRLDFEAEDGNWSAYFPPPLLLTLRWLIAVRSPKPAERSALWSVALQAIHGPQHNSIHRQEFQKRGGEAASASAEASELPFCEAPPYPTPHFFIDTSLNQERQLQFFHGLRAPPIPVLGVAAQLEFQSDRELRRVRRVDSAQVALKASERGGVDLPSTGKRQIGRS